MEYPQMIYNFIAQVIVLKLLLMRSPERLGEIRPLSASRRINDGVVQPRYFPTPYRVRENPEGLRTFYHDSPMKRVYGDISTLRPVSYSKPSDVYLNRNYMVVDQRVTYGKPISPAQFRQLQLQKNKEPEIVTYGHTQTVLPAQRHKVFSIPEDKIKGFSIPEKLKGLNIPEDKIKGFNIPEKLKGFNNPEEKLKEFLPSSSKLEDAFQPYRSKIQVTKDKLPKSIFWCCAPSINKNGDLTVDHLQ